MNTTNEQKEARLNGDLIGDWIDKKCPKCGSKMLGNKVGDEWCSFIECDYGCEDFYYYLSRGNQQ